MAAKNSDFKKHKHEEPGLGHPRVSVCADCAVTPSHMPASQSYPDPCYFHIAFHPLQWWHSVLSKLWLQITHSLYQTVHTSRLLHPPPRPTCPTSQTSSCTPASPHTSPPPPSPLSASLVGCAAPRLPTLRRVLAGSDSPTCALVRRTITFASSRR